MDDQGTRGPKSFTLVAPLTLVILVLLVALVAQVTAAAASVRDGGRP